MAAVMMVGWLLFGGSDAHRISSMLQDCPDGTGCAGATGQYAYNVNGSYTAELQEGNCSAGYVQRLCGECDEGYYEMDGRCEECPERGLMAVLFIALCVCGMLFILYAISQGWNFFKNGALSILLDFLQTMGTYNSFDLNWPDLITDAISLTGLFSFNPEVFASSCLVRTENWYDDWALEMITPLFMLAVFIFLNVVAYVAMILGIITIHRGSMQMANMQNAFLFACSVLHIRLVKMTSLIFYCKEYDDGTVYLVEQPSIECYTETWWYYSSIGFIGLIVYVMGVPLAFYLLLRKHRNELTNPIIKHQMSALYIVYKPELCYWEIAVKLKKASLYIICIMIANNPLYQVMAAEIILLIFCMLSNLYKPFRFTRNNVLQLLSSLCNFFTMFCGMVFYNPLASSSEIDVVTGIWIVLLVGCLIVLTHGAAVEHLRYFASSVTKGAKSRSYLRSLFGFQFMETVFGTRSAMERDHWANEDALVAKHVLTRAKSSVQDYVDSPKADPSPDSTLPILRITSPPSSPLAVWQPGSRESRESGNSQSGSPFSQRRRSLSSEPFKEFRSSKSIVDEALVSQRQVLAHTMKDIEVKSLIEMSDGEKELLSKLMMFPEVPADGRFMFDKWTASKGDDGMAQMFDSVYRSLQHFRHIYALKNLDNMSNSVVPPTDLKMEHSFEPDGLPPLFVIRDQAGTSLKNKQAGTSLKNKQAGTMEQGPADV
ncbi:hypothetical protein CYMTET_28315 [Cymbomonas tetramitiformis]|uniref:TRP C-terminal domain-containing protein n=1 Tax=Cymbomonas tetramitiformis TaxID=36881 RepID=A0AAE0FN85_9CHLO|nr:hypothetical protein CYMTET_28315 [Cymbomonas tetramitiformis]